MLLAAYVALLLGLALNAPPALWQPDNSSFILVIGAIGLWRYGWNLLHLVRSVWYRRVRFRRWRRACRPASGRGREGRGRRPPARARALHRGDELPHPCRDHGHGDRSSAGRGDPLWPARHARGLDRRDRRPASVQERLHAPLAASPCPAHARARQRDGQARRRGAGPACHRQGTPAARGRGHPPGWRRRAAARLPRSHPALLPPDAGPCWPHHRRGLRGGRWRPVDARLAPAALRPASPADVLDGAFGAADHAHRPDGGLPGADRHRPRLHRHRPERRARPLAAGPLPAAHRRGQVDRLLAAPPQPAHALRAGRAGGHDRAPAGTRPAARLDRPDAALVRQHAACQRPGDSAGAAPARPVPLVVPRRSADLDVDAACRARSPPSAWRSRSHPFSSTPMSSG